MLGRSMLLLFSVTMSCLPAACTRDEPLESSQAAAAPASNATATAGAPLASSAASASPPPLSPSATVDPKLDLLPPPARAPAGLIAHLSKFPERLVAHDTPLPLRSEDLIKGRIVWAQSYRTGTGFDAFQVFLCEGRCELPLLQRMRDAKVATLVQSKTATLSGKRPIEVNMTSGGLGGGLVFSSAPSPHRTFDIVVMFSLPPHDIPLSDGARQFFHECEPLNLALSLGHGVDEALFPLPPAATDDGW